MTGIGDGCGWSSTPHWQQFRFQAEPGELRREQVVHHRLRHVERIPLGTSYPAVIDRVTEVLARLPPMPRPPVLTVDATGCGRPVMDLMRKTGLTPLGVTITAGSGETIEHQDARVAKKVLAFTVAVALDTGRLQVAAAGPYVETLRNELRSFRVKVTAGQNESFESWREADHDDLVLGAALAVWTGARLRERLTVNQVAPVRTRVTGRRIAFLAAAQTSYLIIQIVVHKRNSQFKMLGTYR